MIVLVFVTYRCVHVTINYYNNEIENDKIKKEKICT